jgi:hypothetical protein
MYSLLTLKIVLELIPLLWHYAQRTIAVNVYNSGQFTVVYSKWASMSVPDYIRVTISPHLLQVHYTHSEATQCLSGR